MGPAKVIPFQATPDDKVFESFRSGGTESGGKRDQSAEVLFDNLVWLNSDDAAKYLRKSVGALRVMVCRGYIRARKFRRRLYFKRTELDRLLEGSNYRGD